MVEGEKIWRYGLILLTLCLVPPNTVLADVYSITHIYDLVGNRLERTVTANGQTLMTEYTFDDANDCLVSEAHTGPVAMMPLGGERFYAYANSGKLNYKSAAGVNIDKVQAFVMGLPNELSLYAFFAMLLLVPVTFFAPALVAYIKRFKRPPPEDVKLHLSLWRRCLCVLLAYTMLITPLGLQQTAQAATQYNQISTADWSSGNRTIEYTYDANGSCIQKVTKETSTVLEKIEYEYNLANRLAQIVRQYDDAGRVIETRRLVDDENPYNPESLVSEVVLSQTVYNKIGRVDYTIDRPGSYEMQSNPIV